MAGWTAHLSPQAPRIKIGDVQYEIGQNPRIELPNLAAYIDYVHPDRRTFTPDGNSSLFVRVPYETTEGLKTFLARRCARFDALDDSRLPALQSELDKSALPGPSDPIDLPDLSKEAAIEVAQLAVQQKVAAALLRSGTSFTKDQIAAAIAIDPTVADALASLDAASADAVSPSPAILATP